MAEVKSVFKAMADRRERERLEEETKVAEATLQEEEKDRVEEVTEEIEETVIEEAAIEEEAEFTMDAAIVEAMEAEGIEVTEENYAEVLRIMEELEEEEVEEEKCKCGKEKCDGSCKCKDKDCSEKCEEDEEVDEQGGGENLKGGKTFMSPENDGKAKEPASHGSAQAVDQTPSKPNIVARGKKPSISYTAAAMKLREEYEVDEETAERIAQLVMESMQEETTEEVVEEVVAEEVVEETVETVVEEDDIAELTCRLEECNGSQFMKDALAEGKVDMVKRYLSIKEA